MLINFRHNLDVKDLFNKIIALLKRKYCTNKQVVVYSLQQAINVVGKAWLWGLIYKEFAWVLLLYQL